MKNIWVPLSGQIAQQQKVDSIANNIANANTAGFKRDSVVFKEHLTALDKGLTDIDIPNGDWTTEDFYRTQGAENAMVKVDGSYTDFTQGSLQPTNNPLDFALFGKGFFEVLTPSGVRFTRKGNFNLNQQGNIVDSNGFKLLAKAPPSDPGQKRIPNDTDILNRVIKIPTNSKISVSKEGQIFSRDGKIGDMSIVEFKDMHALKKQGHSLFINNAAENILRSKVSTSVNQGFSEASNVNTIREMSELIQAHRQFENIQKAIQTYDSLAGRAASDIAKF